MQNKRSGNDRHRFGWPPRGAAGHGRNHFLPCVRGRRSRRGVGHGRAGVRQHGGASGPSGPRGRRLPERFVPADRRRHDRHLRQDPARPWPTRRFWAWWSPTARTRWRRRPIWRTSPTMIPDRSCSPERSRRPTPTPRTVPAICPARSPSPVRRGRGEPVCCWRLPGPSSLRPECGSATQPASMPSPTRTSERPDRCPTPARSRSRRPGPAFPLCRCRARTPVRRAWTSLLPTPEQTPPSCGLPCQAGAAGIVLQGTGTGNANRVLCREVADATAAGVVVVTSTRVEAGAVVPRIRRRRRRRSARGRCHTLRAAQAIPVAGPAQPAAQARHTRRPASRRPSPCGARPRTVPPTSKPHQRTTTKSQTSTKKRSERLIS